MVLRFEGTRSPGVGCGAGAGFGVCGLSLEPVCGVPVLLMDIIAECLGCAAMKLERVWRGEFGEEVDGVEGWAWSESWCAEGGQR